MANYLESLQSSATRHLRISDSYITGENDLPPEHLREGAFSRWDVKKSVHDGLASPTKPDLAELLLIYRRQ